ncbi:tetratricopeptide (TPR) repeat protein [Oxalobacteraceae bacterium GrIS 2.11]
MQENLILNREEFERHLNELAEMVVRQQGIHFESHTEARSYVKDTTEKLEQLLARGNAMFIEGLRHLIARNQQPVAELASKIVDNLAAPDRVAEIIDRDILKNPASLRLFSEAVNSFYDCGNYQVEESVISVLLTLFPMEPQPFVCYGTLIWRRDGIAEAVSYYQKIVDMFESPILDYFASDCYDKFGNRREARLLLERAFQSGSQAPYLFADVLQLIQSALKKPF